MLHSLNDSSDINHMTGLVNHTLISENCCYNILVCDGVEGTAPIQFEKILA